MAVKLLPQQKLRYANIERELLGVVGALEKFHYFTFGCPVTVLTDHKPLIAIVKKALISAHPKTPETFAKVEQLQCNLRMDTW